MKPGSAVDIRDAFFDRVYALGAADDRIVILTNDMDVFGLRRFRENFPRRFINVGVAEQNMISVAAGLAASGRRPLVFGISSFVTFRCFEQIKFSICSMNLPVVIAGIGSGLAFSFDGPTHHGTQDIAVMRALPDMTIFNPGDAGAARACADLALFGHGPSYVRIDKGPFDTLYQPDDADLTLGFKLTRPSTDTVCVTTGYMTCMADAIVSNLSTRGIMVGHADVFRLKPLDPAFVERVIAPARRIITIEENAQTGGLGTLVGEAVLDGGLGARVLRIAARDSQVLQYGDRDWLHAEQGLDVATVADRIAAWLGT